MNSHSVFLVIGCVTIAATLASLRREHIRTEYSISWLIVGVVLTALAIFPGALEKAAQALGVGPPHAFVILAGVLISILVFEVSHVVSKLRDENVLLAQRVAILEFRINHAEAKDGLKTY